MLRFAPPHPPRDAATGRRRHKRSGLVLAECHELVPVVLETRLPAGLTLAAVDFRNRSPKAVAKHGPDGVVERRCAVGVGAWREKQINNTRACTHADPTVIVPRMVDRMFD